MSADHLRETMLRDGIAILDCGYPHPELPHWRLMLDVSEETPDCPCLTWERVDGDCAVSADAPDRALAEMRHYDLTMPMEVRHADR